MKYIQASFLDKNICTKFFLKKIREHKLLTTFGQKQGTKSLLDKVHSQMVSFFL
jgi:hypothetical protein